MPVRVNVCVGRLVASGLVREMIEFSLSAYCGRFRSM